MDVDIHTQPTEVSFRWVFKEALPKLVPKWPMERVLFFMKDGNPQQCNEILFAMKTVFINACEGTCGYHVVHMGWRTNVPSCVNKLSPPKIEDMVVHCAAGSYMVVLMDDARQCGRQ